MWLVLMFTEDGEQYEYSVIPENPNPTFDEITNSAIKAHVLNCLLHVVTIKPLTEVMVLTSRKASELQNAS